jgi:hypothetical protein
MQFALPGDKVKVFQGPTGKYWLTARLGRARELWVAKILNNTKAEFSRRPSMHIGTRRAGDDVLLQVCFRSGRG